MVRNAKCLSNLRNAQTNTQERAECSDTHEQAWLPSLRGYLHKTLALEALQDKAVRRDRGRLGDGGDCGIRTRVQEEAIPEDEKYKEGKCVTVPSRVPVQGYCGVLGRLQDKRELGETGKDWGMGETVGGGDRADWG